MDCPVCGLPVTGSHAEFDDGTRHPSGHVFHPCGCRTGHPPIPPKK